ncbi:unnamed protein product [Diamesa serratosioi]
MNLICSIILLAFAIHDANSGGPTYIHPSELPFIPSSFQVTTLTTLSPSASSNILSTDTPTDYPTYDYTDFITDFTDTTVTEQEGFTGTNRMNQSGRTSRRMTRTVIPTTLAQTKTTDVITVATALTDKETITEATKPSEKVTEATKVTDKVTIATKPTDKITVATKPTDKMTIATKATDKQTVATKPTEKITTVTSKVTKAPETTKAITTTLLTLSTNLSDVPVPPACVFDDKGDFTSENKKCLRECPEHFIKLDYPEFCCCYLIE